jgi:di/tricarboxylate transporter
MKQTHLLISGLAFLMCLLAAYFGSSVFNAQNFFLIDHLNEMDQLNYYKVKDVPRLNYKGATFTVPFAFLIILAEIRIIWKAKLRRRRNLAMATLLCALIVFVFCLLMLSDPVKWNFNPWGFIWIFMGFFIISGNIYSLFLRIPESTPEKG